MKHCGRTFLIYGLAFWLLAVSTSWSFQHRHQGGEGMHGHHLGLIDLWSSPEERCCADGATESHCHFLILGMELGGCDFPVLPSGSEDHGDAAPVSLVPAEVVTPQTDALPLEHGVTDLALFPVPAPLPAISWPTCEITPPFLSLCPAPWGERSGMLLI